MSKTHFDILGVFQADNVSVVAGVFFTQVFYLFAQEAFGEVRGGQNSCVKVSQKSCVYIYISLLLLFPKSCKQMIFHIFICTENCTESYRNMKNNSLQHEAHPTHKNTFPFSQKSIFFENSTFLRISVSRLFLWPAFGGPKTLVFISF